MPRLLIAVLLLLPIAQAQDRLNRLAHGGQIDESAPVKAHSEIVIDAPPERGWHVLIGVKDWPQWQKNVESADIAGPVAPGTPFTWKTGGAEIHSQITVARPMEQFVWTGVAFNAHAILVWNLQRLPDGRTQVKTSESMSGFMLTLFYSSKQLEATHHDWLTSLKLTAEKPPN